MKTEKAEYSPDYKAQRFVRRVVVEPADSSSEHERLEREVVKTAKARREAEKRFDKDTVPRIARDLLAAEVAEDEAVDALVEFEVKK